MANFASKPFIGLMQQQLNLLVSSELDSGVRSDSGHCCGVSAPQRQEAVILKRSIQKLPRFFK